MTGATSEAAQRDADVRNVGVVDIGSNSVRMVVYDDYHRAPQMKFNEKAICGLGRGLDATGRLSDEAMEHATATLCRFRDLARAMGVGRLDVFATEAVRSASNGPEFVASVEDETGFRVQVLSGGEEAEAAALGVLAAHPRATGVVGDLGGASLELAALEDGRIGRLSSLPIGPLRLQGQGSTRRRVKAHVRETIAQGFSASMPEDGVFYAVGGAWRALARLGIAQWRHSLGIVDGWSLPRDQALALAALAKDLADLAAEVRQVVPRRRLEALPLAGLVMDALLRRLCPEIVVFSAYGVREGRMFLKTSEAERRLDPIVETARRFGSRESRFGGVGEVLVGWTASLFPRETEAMSRLRAAACHLSDIAWSTHADYAAGFAFDRVLHLPLPGLRHNRRAFLGLCIHVRYQGALDEPLVRPALALLDDESRDRAVALGRALDLAYRLSGATAGLIARSRLVRRHESLVLHLPADGSLTPGQATERRLSSLAKALGGLEAEVSYSI